MGALGFPKGTHTFHSLRHTFATMMHGLDVQEATVARIMGHKHKSITFGRYGDKLHTEALRRTLDKLRYDLGPK